MILFIAKVFSRLIMTHIIERKSKNKDQILFKNVLILARTMWLF